MTTALFTDAQIIAQCKTCAPETTGLSDALFAAPVEWARAYCGQQFYTNRTLLALGYATAHAATKAYAATQGSTSAPVGGGLSAGGIMSVSDGEESISYGSWLSAVVAVSAADAALLSTTYGGLLYGLRATRAKALNFPMAV